MTADGHRYYTDLPYTMLDSFPSVFDIGKSSQLDIVTSLSTSSSCMKSLLSLQRRSALAATVSERETLSNSLAELSESYKEGWSSDSEPDSDE